MLLLDIIIDLLNSAVGQLLQVAHLKSTLIVLNLGLAHGFVSILRLAAQSLYGCWHLELIVNLLFDVLRRAYLDQILLVLGSSRREGQRLHV